jgi:hypothetical protein
MNIIEIKSQVLKRLSLFCAVTDVSYRTIFKDSKVYALCSFQKSGRTWVRYFLANYFNLHYKLNIDININSFYDFVPSYNYEQIKTTSNKFDPSNTNMPLILASHSEYKSYMFSNTPVIFVVRSIYDTIVSYFYHKTKHKSEFDGNISLFIRGKENSLKKLADYINSWSKNLANNKSLIVSYEEMHFDTNNAFSQIISFMGITVNEDILRIAIEQSTFDNMLQSELNSGGIPDSDYDVRVKSARRLRSGLVDDYFNHLDAENIEYIKRYCIDNLTFESKKLYEDVGIKI